MESWLCHPKIFREKISSNFNFLDFSTFPEGLQRPEVLFGMVDEFSLFSLNLELRLKDGQVSNVQVEVSFLRRVRLGLESLSVFHAKPRKLLQIYHFCRSQSSASIRIFRGITNPSAVRAFWKT